MSSFEAVHQEKITGELTCLDRIILKGHLTRLYPDGAFQRFLSSQGGPPQRRRPLPTST